LISQPAHSAGALAMMAHWDLHTFWRRLPALAVPLTLIAGEQDLIVPPSVAERAAAALTRQPTPPVKRLPGLGHLAHEEQAATLAALVLENILPTHPA
jgi:magnesium chelatase accessory protein